MGLVSALKNAMRIRSTRRIGRADADRLVSGEPPGPGHPGLGVLLDAAAAPPSVEELAGERAAVARFVTAYRDAAPVPPARTPVPASRSARMAAVKVAAVVAVLAAGGTAVAAETGNLPAGARQFLTGLGVPGPDGGPRPTATGAGRTGANTHAPSPRTPAPSSRGGTADPAEVWALDLCRSWDAARTNPHGKAVPAPTRHALADLAGGEKRIDDFCDDVLGASPSATVRPSASASATGNGNGNDDGNGNGNGGNNDDKNGKKGKPQVTPQPQTSPPPNNEHEH
jgi:hypothetical protein